MINLEPSLLCLRGDVTSNWITFNPILTLNEPAIEIFNDGNVKMKVGNGVNNFLDLPYLNEADNVNSDWNSTGGLSEILNKPTTVSGYGLSDVYTINEVDFKILTIQEASNSTNGFMSINDFIKLSGVSSGATKNDTDQNLKNRQNHTGTQLSNTISDFVKSVNDSQLSEIYIDNTDVTSGDTVCSSINKLQSQNSNIKSNLSSHVNNVNNPHGVTKYQIDLGSVDNTSDVNKPISISTQNALNLKVDKTTSITAGSGLTGGGILSGNTTINVVSLNDGILVNNDNIELKTINDLTTISTTKPLSSAQGKALQDNKAEKTRTITAGNGLTGGGDLSADRTINIANADDSLVVAADSVKVNTNNTLTSTSTTQPLSANQGKVLNEKVVQVETDLNYMYPSVGTAKRILADVGTIKSRSTLNELTNKFLDLLPNTKLLFCPHLAVKLRESGIYKYVTKLYDIGPAMLDGAQTTALNQPYLSGNIAPNEKYALKNPNNGTAYLTHTPISFSATDKWSVTFIYNNFNQSSGLYGIVLSDEGPSHIRFQSNSLYIFNNVSEYTLFPGINKIVGKYAVYTITAPGNGKVNLYLNGVLVATNTFNTGIGFARLFNGSAVSTSYGVFVYYSVRDITLSPTQVQDEYNYLRTLFPEIESVQIGTQTWATSNCEMTCTPQGNVIQEMQAAVNVEKITNAADREFSSDAGFWNKTSGATISNGICNIKTIDESPQGITKQLLTVGKYYKFTYDIVENRGGSLRLQSTPSMVLLDSTVGVNKYVYIKAVDNTIQIVRHATPTDIDIDNVSVQEVGWSDSTNLYNYVYAQTSGTSEQKEYAAVKAAAMWCHYNNDIALGAVYGKLYNWYAVKLLQMDIDYYNAANPTALWGWRIPTSTDFNLLSTYLGNDVAGKKMKKDGSDYWAHLITIGTNESGFSGLGSGRRFITGDFESMKILTKYVTSDSKFYELKRDTDAFSLTSSSEIAFGYSLRLIKA